MSSTNTSDLHWYHHLKSACEYIKSASTHLTWGICLGVMIGLGFTGCVTEHYLAVDRIEVVDQSAIFLETFPEMGTPSELHTKIIDRSEQGVRTLLKLGPKFKTRKDFSVRWANHPALYEQYQLLSDSLGRLDINNPELTSTLGKSTNTDWFISVQFVVVYCKSCQNKAQALLIGQLVESKTGTLLFKSLLQENLPSTLSEQTELGYEMVDEFLTGLKFAVSEKWHLKRFSSLKAM